MTTKTQVALILATGRDDLKCWAPSRGDGRVARYGYQEFPDRWCRRLHQALLTRPYRVVLRMDTWADRPPEEVPLREVFPDGDWWTAGPAGEPRRQQTPGTGGGRPDPGAQQVLVDTQGRLLLRPAKIERLLTALLASRDLRCARVLVFYSDRAPPATSPGGRNDDQGRFYDREPAGNGAIIGDWLAGKEVFDLPGAVRAVNYLEGLDSLEGELYDGDAYGPDYPVRRAAVRLIDNAIRGLADGFDGRVIVSALGGLGQIKPIILASADLHFQGRTFDYWETEAQSRGDLSQVKPLTQPQIGAEVVTPAERLAARAHALGRLQEGDVLGAWGSLAHLDGITHDRAWLDRVSDLARFFRGEETPAALRALLLRGLAGEVLTDRGIESLLLRAFQAEAALQSRRQEDLRVPEALSATSAFVDLALEIGVFSLLRRIDAGLKPDRRRIDQDRVSGVRDRLAPHLHQEEFKGPPPCPEDLIRSDGRLNTTGLAAAGWRAILRHWPLPPPLDRLGIHLDALDDYMEKSELRNLRNQLAHRALSQAEAEDALQRAGRRYPSGKDGRGPLWTLQTPSLGRLGGLFLSSSLVTPIFDAIGLGDPSRRYRELMAAAMDALRAPIEVGP